MSFNFGFNEEALHSIKRQLQDLHFDFRRGSLFWDEMSLTIDVKYDAQKMPFEGFIDYGKKEIEDNNTEFTDQLADHALVFIFRPYRSSWIQHIAVSTTKAAEPGHVISRRLVTAIVVLEAVLTRVTLVTCIGIQTNKRAWAVCGISGKRDKNGKISCSMKHQTAMERGERIWFLQDVSHLFNSVRNHIFS